jgi:hypothetical protein
VYLFWSVLLLRLEARGIAIIKVLMRKKITVVLISEVSLYLPLRKGVENVCKSLLYFIYFSLSVYRISEITGWNSKKFGFRDLCSSVSLNGPIQTLLYMKLPSNLASGF